MSGVVYVLEIADNIRTKAFLAPSNWFLISHILVFANHMQTRAIDCVSKSMVWACWNILFFFNRVLPFNRGCALREKRIVDRSRLLQILFERFPLLFDPLI